MKQHIDLSLHSLLFDYSIYRDYIDVVSLTESKCIVEVVISNFDISK